MKVDVTEYDGSFRIKLVNAYVVFGKNRRANSGIIRRK